jgi:hypothetical protein
MYDGSRESVTSLPLLIADWPEVYRDAYVERAGILEFDANMKREAAEWLAERQIRKLFWKEQKL